MKMFRKPRVPIGSIGLIGLTGILSLLSCGGSRQPVASSSQTTTLESLQAFSNGHLIEFQFVLGGVRPDRLDIQRRGIGRGTTIDDIASFESPPVGETIAYTDSVVYSGMDISYRVVVPRDEFTSRWTPKVRSLGPSLYTQMDPGSGKVTVQLSASIPEAVQLKVIRFGEGEEDRIVYEGVGAHKSFVDVGLSVSTEYRYQAVTTLSTGVQMLSWRDPVRLFVQTAQGVPVAPGASGEVTVAEILQGGAVLMFNGEDGISFATQSTLTYFKLTTDFSDPVTPFDPGSSSAALADIGGFTGRRSHFVAAGIRDGNVVVRFYSAEGEFLGERVHASLPGETRTHLVKAWRAAPREVLYLLSTEKRIWELADMIAGEAPRDLPASNSTGVALVGNRIFVLQEDPPALYRATYRDRSAHNWQQIDLPEDLEPLSITANFDHTPRIWILDAGGRVFNVSTSGDDVTYIRLPDHDYQGARLFTAPLNAIGFSDFRGLATIRADGRMEMFRRGWK